MSETRLRPLIVPIFIPNKGCPSRCIFCEQGKITSLQSQSVNGRYVREVIDKAISSKKFDTARNPEVAFYGGTFSNLPLRLMIELLGAVAPYIKKGFFHSIRVSTRPDALGADRLDLMKDYGVLTVELGVQSMDNDVLKLSKRGHTAADTVNAVHLLRKYGFRVGAQLMPGLPGDSVDTFRATITKVISLHPDMARLYPLLVIKGTGLAKWYQEGKYQPLELEKAVQICIESCIRLEAEGIPVIRIGLMSSPSLLEDGRIMAGPWHPAFGFLVRSGIHQKNIQNDLPAPGKASEIRIFAPQREIALIRGYKNRGLKLIEKQTQAKVISVHSDDSIPPGRIRVESI